MSSNNKEGDESEPNKDIVSPDFMDIIRDALSSLGGANVNEITNPNIITFDMVSSAIGTDDMIESEEDPEPSESDPFAGRNPEKQKRCAVENCIKRLTLMMRTKNLCRCKLVFCDDHRIGTSGEATDRTHKCDYDYMSAEQRRIKRESAKRNKYDKTWHFSDGMGYTH